MLYFSYNLSNNFLNNIKRLASYTLIYFIIKKIFFQNNNFSTIKYNKNNEFIKDNVNVLINEDVNVLINEDVNVLINEDVNVLINEDDNVLINEDDNVLINEDVNVLINEDVNVLINEDKDDKITNDYSNKIIKYNELGIINNCYNCKKIINKNNLIFCFDSRTFCKIICRDIYIKNIFITKYIKINN